MKTILSIYIILMTLTAFSQNRNVDLSNGVFNNNLEFFALQKVNNIYNSQFYNNIKGSYYLFNEWNKCNVTNIDNKSFIAPCNYNLHTDEFEIRIDQDLYLVSQSKIKEIVILDKKYIPNNSFISSDYSYSSNYYTTLAKGENISLIEMFKLKLIQVASNTSLGLHETKLEIKKTLFFLFKNGNITKVPLSNKKIKNTLKENTSINFYSKNINLKKTNNLIYLINNS